MIKISEIFSNTIQGEGPHVGLKTCFIRVSNCDFKCEWCDSSWVWDDKNSKKWDEKELGEYLVNYCNNTGVSNVILTGGNPCIYNFTGVINILHDNDITVDVETQGSIYPEWLNNCDLIVISPKGKSSGMPDIYDNLNCYIQSNITALKNKCEICIKIPIFNEEDFKFAEKYYNLAQKFKKEGLKIDLYLSVGNENVTEEGDISNRILKKYEELIKRVNNSNMKRVFILPQVHTLIWGNKSGV